MSLRSSLGYTSIGFLVVAIGTFTQQFCNAGLVRSWIEDRGSVWPGRTGMEMLVLEFIPRAALGILISEGAAALILPLALIFVSRARSDATTVAVSSIAALVSASWMLLLTGAVFCFGDMDERVRLPSAWLHLGSMVALAATLFISTILAVSALRQARDITS
jgi:hypothetical protein